MTSIAMDKHGPMTIDQCKVGELSIRRSINCLFGIYSLIEEEIQSVDAAGNVCINKRYRRRAFVRAFVGSKRASKSDNVIGIRA